MKAHEYQAKAVLAEFGVPVPRGKVAATPEEAAAAAAEIGGRVVVKAQVHAGGRGKAGGVKLVNTPDEAAAEAKRLIGSRLVTHQTGPEGALVPSVLIEEAVETAKELYLSVIVDSQAKMPVIMASEAGGMDIEEVAATMPDKILRAWVDPVMGYQASIGRRLAYGMNMDAALIRPMAELVGNVFKAFVAKDCAIAEINPLIITTDGKLLAADAKLNFDDNSMYRHPEVVAMRDTTKRTHWRWRPPPPA